MAVTITLTDTQAAAIPALIDQAARGRAADQATAADPPQVSTPKSEAEAAAKALMHQQTRITHPVLDAADTWGKRARAMADDDIWIHFNCAEADACADLIRAAGHPDVAEMILNLHAEDDDPDEGEDHCRT